tara:strand:- start:328 stop:516 length:189 start_codon:yes stop_codon:yes gene_type:complete
MFTFFKADPAERLRARYHTKLGEALFAERHGKLQKSSALNQEAELIRQQLIELETAEEMTKH